MSFILNITDLDIRIEADQAHISDGGTDSNAEDEQFDFQ